MKINNILSLAIDTVAVYRLTKLALEDGITEDLRLLIWDRYPPESTKIGYLFTCPWCISIWAGAVIFSLRAANPSLADTVSSILAASYASGKAYELGL